MSGNDQTPSRMTKYVNRFSFLKILVVIFRATNAVDMKG